MSVGQKHEFSKPLGLLCGCSTGWAVGVVVTREGEGRIQNDPERGEREQGNEVQIDHMAQENTFVSSPHDAFIERQSGLIWHKGSIKVSIHFGAGKDQVRIL